VDARGVVQVMFRNALDGSRDLYLTRSEDGGKTFAPARKLGTGTWNVDACPMDGGGLTVDADGRVMTTWRRGSTLFAADDKGAERSLGAGNNPTVSAARTGAYFAWTQGGSVMLKKPGAEAPEPIDAHGTFPSLVTLPDGAAVVAWESKGTLMIRTVP
jgi:photosystem II stability/assembly factor-like uncharacterized protein